MYDHPFQWGSKRNGPDLARVGSKYSDAWHRDHMRNPRSVVPTSIMPGYPWMEKTPLDGAHIAEKMKVLAIEGVPYTPEMIEKAQDDLKAQAALDSPGLDALQKRYPRAVAHETGVAGNGISEFDAVVAYLQVLGTEVDFKVYDDKANIR
jgi:cytochrome c oxidase cbb3-type subunit 2